ncbi:hypothetical protein B0H10DRAFT_2448907 [Mycena sp. CBHHK59/15]|nr:hypothetical protein B0H10DRAFT_2448907 [Mycena sp. CBHHK59/15]
MSIATVVDTPPFFYLSISDDHVKFDAALNLTLLEEQRLRRQTEASARDNRAAARRPDSATLSNESIPSTPTISTPSSLTLSPATTPPLPEKTTISNYKMALLELFRGDARCDKPHYWLRKLQGSMAYDAKDEEKLHRFAMGLAPGTHADKWWTGLDAKDKVSWADVVKAFGKKWVVPVEAEESPEELKSRIKRTILHSADLGKLVGPPGDEMYAHLRWVTDMKPLVESINDPTMLLKGDVRATLPLERIYQTTSWNAASASGVAGSLRFDPDRTGAERMVHIAAFKAQMPTTSEQLLLYRHADPLAPPRSTYTYGVPASAQRSPAPRPQNQTPPHQTPTQSYTPSTPQRAPPPHMPHMQQAPLQWQASPNNPFVTPGQPNAATARFMQSLSTSTPGSPSAGRSSRNSLGGDPVKDVALARRAVANPRVYQATPAGMQQYQNDLAAWDTQYGPASGVAPDYATFPLTPGTLPAGSKECWTCGLIANPPHFGLAKCRASGAHAVSTRESNVRALIGNALFLPGERTPGHFQSSVSQIDAEERDAYNPMGMYDVHQMLFEDQVEEQSGNGEGLA